jgi:hypothetical protein
MRQKTFMIMAMTALAVACQGQISVATVRQIVGLKTLHGALRFHQSLLQYDAEFSIRAYNPLLSQTHHDEFGMWYNKEQQTFALLAIRTELYGQSYSASPAAAQWWEGNQAVSVEHPTDLFSIDAPWLGPFGDTLVGSCMLDAGYRLNDIWGSQPIRQLTIDEGVLQFQTRGSDGSPVDHIFPYWRIRILTANYEAVVHVGREIPLILYYSKSKDGRLIWEESWYPFEWR